MKSLAKILTDARTEEELKHLFAKFFKIKLSTKNYIDLYTPQILFEFKYDAPLKNVQTRAACIAQTLYYIRRLKFGSEVRTPSRSICIVTKSYAIFFDTKNFSSFYKRTKYDWDLAPSSPCKKLVADLADSEVIREAHIYDLTDAEEERAFVELIKQNLVEQLTLRKFRGEFYTPLTFAQKAVEYLLRTVNFLNGEYRIWDMAAGTGNLEFALPSEALKYCYLSTLLPDDADYCKRIFPDATVFQYDYLNDDVEFLSSPLLEKLGARRKMPQKLANDLKNPDLKWLIFINPPYVTANDYTKQNYRSGVSATAIKNLMAAENIKESSRELTIQFLYRIIREFEGRQAWLGMFSSLRYITTVNDEKFRDKVFKCKYERGFMFSSENFEGCKGKFPVGFLIWSLNEKISLESQNISLDVYNSQLEKFAEKKIYCSRLEETLNKWVKRPPRIKKFPPMSGGLNVGYKNKVRCDLIAENFLAGFMCKSNDLYQQSWTAFLSGPYVSGHGMSVTPENFERCMVIHAVRRLPKVTWLNNKDQFLQPTKPLPSEFISDAVIWSLFSASNQTVSLRNVEYEGEIYRMPNNFYPFLLEEIRNWKCSSPDIRLQIEMAQEDRFAALWLRDHKLSAQAQEILDAGRELYRKFYAELANLDTKKFKIADWDAGWYQIRMSLGESVDLEKLSAKLLPQIYELGFLRNEVRYF